MLPKEWTGELVGIMHTKHISQIDLAKELGMTNRYVNMVLNGHRYPPGAEKKFRTAVNHLIERGSSNEN